jgi:hypothetical protein
MSYERLREYIEKSELRIVNDNFRVRLSPALAMKYDAGEYKNVINLCAMAIEKINAFGFEYPSRANPIFYLYLVPQGDGQMLNLPSGKINGGRPVASFDTDGFPRAYGLTASFMGMDTSNVAVIIGNIHEFAHLVNSMYFIQSEGWLSEGIAEVFPYYLMDYEKIDEKHREMIASLTESDILNSETLIYGFDKYVDYSKPTQLRSAYISSYLLVRGILKQIEKKYNCDKISAMKKLMEYVRYDSMNLYNNKDYLVFSIADFIGMPREELHTGKSLQLSVQKNIAAGYN